MPSKNFILALRLKNDIGRERECFEEESNHQIMTYQYVVFRNVTLVLGNQYIHVTHPTSVYFT
ncbi:MAG: hypothetical protein ACI90V_001294 [Bacillariaceae sp.]|jgi:hypothetical protein